MKNGKMVKIIVKEEIIIYFDGWKEVKMMIMIDDGGNILEEVSIFVSQGQVRDNCLYSIEFKQFRDINKLLLILLKR